MWTGRGGWQEVDKEEKGEEQEEEEEEDKEIPNKIRSQGAALITCARLCLDLTTA